MPRACGASHAPLAALLEPQLKIDASPVVLSPIESERKGALLRSSPGFNTTGDRAFKENCETVI